MRHSLSYRGNRIPLSIGKALIGRSVGCKVTLEGAEVSRRHARLTIAEDGLVVEDLASDNGVFVNGERVDRSRRLVDGDRLMVGGHELRVVVEDVADDAVHGQAAAPPDSVRASIDRIWEDDEDEALDAFGAVTSRTEPHVMICAAVQGELDAGQIEQAEQLLSSQAASLLESAKHQGRLGKEVGRLGASRAARLALATGRAKWVAWALELVAVSGTTLPDETLRELDAALDKIGALEAPSVRQHLATLRARPGEPSAAERRLLARLEGLVG